jgi:hypothetical protein
MDVSRRKFVSHPRRIPESGNGAAFARVGTKAANKKTFSAIWQRSR